MPSLKRNPDSQTFPMWTQRAQRSIRRYIRQDEMVKAFSLRKAYGERGVDLAVEARDALLWELLQVLPQRQLWMKLQKRGPQGLLLRRLC